MWEGLRDSEQNPNTDMKYGQKGLYKKVKVNAKEVLEEAARNVVCGGLRWSVVVCGGLWWSVVVCGGLRWSVVVCGGLWSSVSVFVCVCVGRCVSVSVS